MSPTEGTWSENGAGCRCLPISTYTSVFQCLYLHSPLTVLGSSLPNREPGGEAWASGGLNTLRQRRELRKGDIWLFSSGLRDANIWKGRQVPGPAPLRPTWEDSQSWKGEGDPFAMFWWEKKEAKQRLRCVLELLQLVGQLTRLVPSAGCGFGSKPWPGGPKGECPF